jgi:CBS domain-containing membrane protein
VQALPVVNRARQVIGIVTRSDFLAQVEMQDRRDIGRRLRAFLARNTNSHSDCHEVVGQIMTAPVKTAFASTPAVELVPLMADVGLHHIPVVDERRKLVGMVTQTDLVGALYEICLTHLSAPRTGAP